MAVAKKICLSFQLAYFTAGDLNLMPAAAGAVQRGNVLPPTTVRPALRLRGNARQTTTTTGQRGRALPSTTPLPTTSSPALAQPVRASLSEAAATPTAPTPATAQPLRELGTTASTSSLSSTPPAPAKAKPLRASGADEGDSARRPETREALRPPDDDEDDPHTRTPRHFAPIGPPLMRRRALGEMLPICYSGRPPLPLRRPRKRGIPAN